MATITIDIHDEEKERAIKAFLKALKIPFKASKAENNDSPYDPEFVKKIKESQRQIKEGKYVTFSNMDDLRKHFGINDL